jgi:hypothetical protein
LIRIRSKNETSSSVVAYNEILKLIPPNAFVIIQNAECMHIGDVVERMIKIFENDKDAIIFPECWSTMNDKMSEELFLKRNDKELVQQFISFPHKNRDGYYGWYIHKQNRPLHFHFCVGMSMHQILQNGMFNIDFMNVVGYDDNDFAERLVYQSHKLHKIYYLEHVHHAFVVHQYHDKFYKHSIINSQHFYFLHRKYEVVLNHLESDFVKCAKTAVFYTDKGIESFLIWHPYWIVYTNSNIQSPNVVGFDNKNMSFPHFQCKHPILFQGSLSMIRFSDPYITKRNIAFVDNNGNPLFEWIALPNDTKFYKKILDTDYILII